MMGAVDNVLCDEFKQYFSQFLWRREHRQVTRGELVHRPTAALALAAKGAMISGVVAGFPVQWM